MAKKRIGEMLVEAGEVTEEQVQEALAVQQEKGGTLGMILVNLGYLERGILVNMLEVQTKEFIQRVKEEEANDPDLAELDQE